MSVIRVSLTDGKIALPSKARGFRRNSPRLPRLLRDRDAAQSEPHDVIAAIYVDHFTRNPTAGV